MLGMETRLIHMETWIWDHTAFNMTCFIIFYIPIQYLHSTYKFVCLFALRQWIKLILQSQNGKNALIVHWIVYEKQCANKMNGFDYVRVLENAYRNQIKVDNQKPLP